MKLVCVYAGVQHSAVEGAVVHGSVTYTVVQSLQSVSLKHYCCLSNPPLILT